MPSRCSRPTAGASSGRRTGTAACRTRPTSSSPTGWSSRSARANPRLPVEAQGMGHLDRRRGGHLDRAAIVPDRGLPHPVGEHGKHPARGGLPVRQQGDLRGRARDSVHGTPLLAGAGLRRAPAGRHRRVPVGRRLDTQPEHREAGDRRGRRHAPDGARHGVPQQPPAGRAVCAAPPGTGAGAGFPTGADPRLAVAALRRAGRGALPSHDARLGSGRAVRGAFLRDGRQPRRVLRQPFLGLPAAVAHRRQAGHHLFQHRDRPVAHPLEQDLATAEVNPIRNGLLAVAFQGALRNSSRESKFEPVASPSDRALVERMTAGDDRALGELYDRHGATLYALAVAIARERADAEEIVADALGQAWRTASQFDPGRGSVGAWLATITRSRALDLVRARGRRARALARAAGESGEGLAECVACRADVQAFREAAAALALAAPPAAPPPGLRERVLREARRGRPLAGRRAAWPWLAAAAVVVAVAAGYGYWRERTARDEMSTVLVAMRARLDSADRLVGAILDSTVGTADLAATGKAPTMRLYWNRARGLVVLAAFDLPPAPSGRTYQLWAIKKGQNPVSLGTFNTAAGGRAVVTLPAPAGLKPDLSAVTEEPAGGSPQPTQQPFLVGTWQGI